jgi:GT2 family glycosyltransferase
MRPRTSILMPAFDAHATVRESVESALAQTVGDLELIVVDDGSADETPEVVSSYAARDERVRLISQANAGTSAARNRGLAEARGMFVSLLDNDDAWLPTHLQRSTERLEAAPGAGLAYADAWILDDASGRINRRTSLSFYPHRAAPDADADELYAALIEKNFVIASSATLTREALDAVGAFDAELRGTDDWDMWLRVAGAGFGAVRAAPEPLVVLRYSATSQSSDLPMMVAGNLDVLRRAIGREPEGSTRRVAAEERLAANEAWLARLTEPRPGQALRAAIRSRLGRIRRALTGRRTWRTPPAEVTAALGELGEESRQTTP